MEVLYGALQRLETEPDNEALLDWVKNCVKPEFGVIEGLISNFIDYVDEKDYAKQILKILKKLN